MKDETHRSIIINDTSAAATAMQPRAAAFRRISWGAVLAGAIVAIVLQMTLNLLGLGIGLGTINPTSEANPLSGLGIGAIIWYAISTLIALFLGGWVAGRLAGIPRPFDSILHGVLTWCLFTLFSAYILTTTVGKLVSGVGNLVSNTISKVGQGVSEVAGSSENDANDGEGLINFENVSEEAQELLRQTGQPALQPENLKKQAARAQQIAKEGVAKIAQNPTQAGKIFDQTVDKIVSQGDQAVKSIDREAAVNAIVAKSGKSRAEAEQMVDNWINTYERVKVEAQQTAQQAKQQALQTAEDVSGAVSKAAIYAFFGLVLGGAAASIGGKLGEPHDLAVQANNNPVA